LIQESKENTHRISDEPSPELESKITLNLDEDAVLDESIEFMERSKPDRSLSREERMEDYRQIFEEGERILDEEIKKLDGEPDPYEFSLSDELPPLRNPPLRKSGLDEKSSMRTYIEDGVVRYSRHGQMRPEDIRRLAERYSREDAFRMLRDSYWTFRREDLRKNAPDIYGEIRYWESHWDEYLAYMGMKLVFSLPYKDQDFWVRKPRRLKGIG
jgi:hypothetical protein